MLTEIGIPSFDELIGGGLPRGYSYTIIKGLGAVKMPFASNSSIMGYEMWKS